MRLVDLWERRKSPRSQIGLARTRLCARRFIELVGDLEPHEVTRAHVIAYRDELENLPRMKSANIAEHLCKMHGLFNLALSEGIISINPAHGIRARDFGIKLSAKRQGFTSTQVRDIFQALTGETDAFGWVVRLLAYHGMRSGEACQLRSADVTVNHLPRPSSFTGSVGRSHESEPCLRSTSLASVRMFVQAGWIGMSRMLERFFTRPCRPVLTGPVASCSLAR